jgi:hypothetical protein
MRPAVTILDTGGNEVEADVVHTSFNQLVIRFAIPGRRDRSSYLIT